MNQEIYAAIITRYRIHCHSLVYLLAIALGLIVCTLVFLLCKWNGNVYEYEYDLIYFYEYDRVWVTESESETRCAHCLWQSGTHDRSN